MMGKKRKISVVLRRMTGLALAVLMGFSSVSDYVTVYADSSSSVANGKTTTQDVSGGTSTNSFGRFGTYIAVTPVFQDSDVTDVEEVQIMNTDSGVELTDSFYTEELVSQEEANLSLPNQTKGTLAFVSENIWKYSRSTFGSKYTSGKYRLWATANGYTTGSVDLRTYKNNVVLSGNGESYTVSGVTTNAYSNGAKAEAAIVADKFYNAAGQKEKISVLNKTATIYRGLMVFYLARLKKVLWLSYIMWQNEMQLFLQVSEKSIYFLYFFYMNRLPTISTRVWRRNTIKGITPPAITMPSCSKRGDLRLVRE